MNTHVHTYIHMHTRMHTHIYTKGKQETGMNRYLLFAPCMKDFQPVL